MCSDDDKSIVYFLAGLEKVTHNESESVANTRESSNGLQQRENAVKDRESKRAKALWLIASHSI